MPRQSCTGSLVRRHLLQHFARSPAPEPQISFCIATPYKLSVRRNSRLQSKSAHFVAVESLSGMVNDGVHTLVDRDLVVERLAENVVARRVECHGGHGGHVGFLDVSRWRVVAVVPAQHLAVIRRADELPTVLVEAHRVHCRFVVVVRHRALYIKASHNAHLARADIELMDTRVLGGSQEGIRIGRSPHALERNRSLGVVANALAALRVPQLDIPIEGRGEEGLSVRRERDPAHTRSVAHVGPLYVAAIVHIPDFDLAVTPHTRAYLHIHASRQQKMAVGREELDALHRFGVSRPRTLTRFCRDLPFVDHLGRQERSLLVRWMQIRGRNDPRSTQIILLFLPVERRLRLFDWNSEAGRFERIDGRFLVHHVFGCFAGANPLHRIKSILDKITSRTFLSLFRSNHTRCHSVISPFSSEVIRSSSSPW